MEEVKVLLVEDDVDAISALKLGLEEDRRNILTATSRNDAINIIKSEIVDIVVTDLKLKDGSGLDILNFIQQNYPQISVIVITAYGSVDTAIQAIRGGAYEYLQKPFRMADLKRIINRVSENILLRREIGRLKQRVYEEPRYPNLVGNSPRFRQIVEFAKQIAPAQSTVLITGESGTGKEVVASAIHYFSPRRDKPFIKINCGAIPDNLLEAELFGYEKGAFTGAQKQKRGKIELAHEGTLFLDEIGELPRPMQVKLLLVLQNGEFERLGGTITLKVNIRIIAATNSDLDALVKKGDFREDLFYRLNVISLHVPPLRERQEDIPYLVQHFIEKYNKLNTKNIQGIDPAVMKQLFRHPWRGNVRELENMVERAVVFAKDDILKLHHFPGLNTGIEDSERNLATEVGMSLADIEKLAIQKTLQYYNYDKAKTAKTLQIGVATLYRKIKEYNLEEA